MGVHGLWSLLKPYANITYAEQWRGKRVAVDASIWMSQFTAMTKPGEDAKEVVLQGFMNRLLKMIFYEIQPVIVFDGAAPMLKVDEQARRAQRRGEMEAKKIEQQAKRILNAQMATGTMSLEELEKVEADPDADKVVVKHSSPAGKKLTTDRHNKNTTPSSSVKKKRLAKRKTNKTPKKRLYVKKNAESVGHFAESVTDAFVRESIDVVKGMKLQQARLEGNLLASKGSVGGRSAKTLGAGRRPELAAGGTNLFLGKRSDVEQQVAGMSNDAANAPFGSAEFILYNKELHGDGDEDSASSTSSVVIVESEAEDDVEDVEDETSSSSCVVVESDESDEEIVNVIGSSSSDDDEYEDVILPTRRSLLGGLPPQQQPRYSTTTLVDNDFVDVISISSSEGDNAVPREQMAATSAAEAIVIDSNPGSKMQTPARSTRQGTMAKKNTDITPSFIRQDNKPHPNLPTADPTAAVGGKMKYEHMEIINLLELCGIPYIFSPGEADSQCAFLSRHNLVDAVLTEDSDVVAHGATVVLRGFFGTGHVKEYRSTTLASVGLTPEVMAGYALLVGCDYTLGIKNVGNQLALDLLTAFIPRECASDDHHVVSSSYETDPYRRVFKALMTIAGQHEALLEGDATGSKFTPVEDDICLIQYAMRRGLRGKLKTLTLPPSFPSEYVMSAFAKPVVDASLEPFVCGTVDFEGLRRFAWMRSLQPQIQQRIAWTEKEVSKIEEKQREDASRTGGVSLFDYGFTKDKQPLQAPGASNKNSHNRHQPEKVGLLHMIV